MLWTRTNGSRNSQKSARHLGKSRQLSNEETGMASGRSGTKTSFGSSQAVSGGILGSTLTSGA